MLTQMDCSLNVTVLDIFSRQKNPIKHCATSLDTHTHSCLCSSMQYISIHYEQIPFVKMFWKYQINPKPDGNKIIKELPQTTVQSSGFLRR